MNAAAGRPTVYLLFHFRGRIIEYKNGEYVSAEGIPRVMRRLVHAILETTNLDVCVTCDSANERDTSGFFDRPQFRGRLRFLVRDVAPVQTRGPLLIALRRRWARFWNDVNHFKARVVMAIDLKWVPRWFLRWSERLPLWMHAFGLDRGYVKIIDADPNVHSVLVPHYLTFPEALYLRAPLRLYVPDFIPEFFPDNYHALYDHFNMLIGRMLARKATHVLTNSFFTKDYLPNSGLQVDSAKITVLPIPLLMISPDKKITGMAETVGIAAKPYLFYPTQNRANKRLDFALTVFAEIRKSHPDLRFVLTAAIHDIPAVAAVFQSLRLAPFVDIRRQITDGELQSLYAGASALLFSSIFEGNFPPQIFEALSVGTPIVASDIPMIREVLGDATADLGVAKALDVADFVAKLEQALSFPDEVRHRQARALAVLRSKTDDGPFRASVSTFFNH